MRRRLSSITLKDYPHDSDGNAPEMMTCKDNEIPGTSGLQQSEMPYEEYVDLEYLEDVEVDSSAEGSDEQEETEIFTCDVCQTVFQSHKSLMLHSRIHQEIPEPNSESENIVADFVCSICNQSLI